MEFKKKYIVATRPSLLAKTQTEQTVNLLRKQFTAIEFEIIQFSTHGDKVTDKPLTEFGGTGVFVKELENAISRGEADFAIHSLKDVPNNQPDGFMLASFPQREDPRDVVLTHNGKNLIDLKEDCIIGTGSPRRIVQIAKFKPKASFKELRGNIDTRLRKLEEGEYDAIVLAAAGLKRLGKQIPDYSYLSVETCVHAIGQGIITLECKSNDVSTIQLLRSINHTETEIAAKSERAFMTTIGGGCKFPLGAFATIRDNRLTLSVMIGDHKTNQVIYNSASSKADDSEELGIRMGFAIMEEAVRHGISFNM